ncbi:hypothetical protein LC087_15875 [Bacillus carboniphilus]|uniref:Uncharacterized protein n=1 Tax=Bacillus carboniphilus TaxID=86663 RepID=A0ABY9JX60_9BACI|nr:hypothetical protein [Bacillus carboniphilus]WLR42200.1 hypothetical protein LC087_15875 [Bacillus carboniphilus]
MNEQTSELSFTIDNTTPIIPIVIGSKSQNTFFKEAEFDFFREESVEYTFLVDEKPVNQDQVTRIS